MFSFLKNKNNHIFSTSNATDIYYRTKKNTYKNNVKSSTILLDKSIPSKIRA